MEGQGAERTSAQPSPSFIPRRGASGMAFLRPGCKPGAAPLFFSGITPFRTCLRLIFRLRPQKFATSVALSASFSTRLVHSFSIPYACGRINAMMYFDVRDNHFPWKSTSLRLMVSYTPQFSGVRLAFLKNPGEAMQALQTPAPYSGSAAWAINRRWQIVGSAYLSVAPYTHPVLWDQGIMYNLNDLTVNLPFPEVLWYATGINDHGWITVMTRYSSGAGLLIPVGDSSPAIQLLLLDQKIDGGS